MTLCVLGLKFSLDGWQTKEMLMQMYGDQKKLSIRWMRIMQSLPIGVLVTKDNNVIHSNKKMLEIIGKD